MFAMELQRANAMVNNKRNTGDRPTIIIVKNTEGEYVLGESKIVTSDVAEGIFSRAFVSDRDFNPDSPKLHKRSASDIVTICKRFGIPVKKPSSQRKKTKKILIGTIELLLDKFKRQHQPQE